MMSADRTNAGGRFRWLGRGEVLHVRGFEITDPLTYAGDRHYADFGRSIEPSLIDRSLPVTSVSRTSGLPYWPWYERLTPEQRFIYLQWLATDRTKLPPEDGYLFIYYYGLERRALVDEADYGLIVTEAYRLKRMHSKQSPSRSGGSFQNYCSAFLWFLVARKPEKLELEHIKTLVKATASWSEDSLAAALAWFAGRNQPLPSWMAYVLAEQSPLSQRSVVIRRVGKEFRELFARRYEAELGQGLLLRTSKRESTVSYRPASGALQPMTIRVPNPLGVSSQFRHLPEIWNECIPELRKLSSVARQGGMAALTPEAWEALPAELRSQVEYPLSIPVYQLITESTDEQGWVQLPASRLAALMEIQERPRLTLKQSELISRTAEYAGFAIEPDARLTGQRYDWNEPITAFPQAYEGEPDTKRYGGAACILRLGMEIAEADGEVQEEELARIVGQIETGFQLNDHEKRRLEALKSLLLKTGSDVKRLGARLQRVLPADGCRTIGRLLVAVAGIDGVITDDELAALRRCYRALGLPADLLQATLDECAPGATDEPVTVMQGQPAVRGEAIPPPPGKPQGVQLNRELIMKIMSETREVSIMLAEAMSVNDAEPDEAVIQELVTVVTIEPATALAEQEQTSAATLEPALPDGVPARYAGLFVAITAMDRWARIDADALAREHGHMLAGAIEAINDWAFERLGTQLIYDDGDQITIERSLLEDTNSL